MGSSLVKAAMFGADANWGRVLCAMGYSKAPFRPEYVDVAFCVRGGPRGWCASRATAWTLTRTLAKSILSEKRGYHRRGPARGRQSARPCWGCDLTYDYVKINGDYRT